jgi:hypothetical protein
MKTQKLFSVAAVAALVGSCLLLCGCNDETKPDQALIDSMNKQRGAGNHQPMPGSNSAPAPAPAPGK